MNGLIETASSKFNPQSFKRMNSIIQIVTTHTCLEYDVFAAKQLGAGRIVLTAPRQAHTPAKRIDYLPRWKERKAKEIMRSEMSANISISKVAQACSLSRSHFSRAFKNTTGMSPKEWLINLRIERAQQLLAEGAATLSEISLECGFADQSHFSRSFSKHTGMTPMAWRKAGHLPPVRHR